MVLFLPWVLALLATCQAQHTEIHYMHPHKAMQYVNDRIHTSKALGSSHESRQIVELLHELLYTPHNTSPLPAVSDACSKQLLFAGESLMRGQSWMSNMLDAAGKPGSGLLTGHTNWLGDFDECVATKSTALVNATFQQESFRGKYCTLSAYLPMPSQAVSVIPAALSFGLCVPEGCSNHDTAALVNSIVSNASNSSIHLSAACQKHDVPLSGSAIAAITVYAMMVAICVLATVYDVISQKLKSQPQEDETTLLLPDKTDVKKPEHQQLQRGTMGHFLMCFSLYTNGVKLMSGKKIAGSLGCLHGIRFLSMCWVILGHSLVFTIQTVGNLATVFSWISTRWTFQVIMNATVSVDSFFVLSGLLSVYLMLKGFEKSKPTIGKFLASVPVMYLHRYLRLTPAYGLMILFYSTVSFYFYESPFRPQDTITDVNCKNNTVLDLFYLNNIVDVEHGCASWGWYLANDFQFFLITPFIAYVMYRSTLLGLITAVVPVLTSVGSAIGTTVYYDLSITFNGAEPRDPANPSPHHNAHPSGFYFYPWIRYQSFGIGVVYACLLWKYGKQFKRMPAFIGLSHSLMRVYIFYTRDTSTKQFDILNLCLWGVSGVMMLAYLYGPSNVYINHHKNSAFEAALYNGVGRSVWAIALGYIIIACITGNGGCVDEFLSWSGFIPLSRMTYCAYLVHPVIMTVVSSAHKSLDTWTPLVYATTFIGYLVLGYSIGFVFSLVFEAPFMNLDKHFLTGRLSKRMSSK